MKNYLIISLLILSVGFPQQEYNSNDLIEMDNGLFTVKFSDEPITGKVYGYFGENNKKVYMGNLRSGKQDGKWVSYYHSTGKKVFEYNFKDGERDGLRTEWYWNGQKYREETYKNGIQIGKHESWLDDGTKEWEYYYNDDGTRDSTKLTTRWYESGQKRYEGYIKTLNDTTSDWNGLYTTWYENGQKEEEGTYKDGEKDGLFTIWYLSGDNKKTKMYYKKNVLHGSHKRYNKKDEVTYHVIYIDDLPEIFVFGDFYDPQSYPKWESSIDKSLKHLKDLLNDGFINEEDYILFKIDLLKDEKYWNEDGSVKE